jgi:hypothetical protein
MSLDTSHYISELYSNIRARPIAWDAYVRSNLVSDADVKKIKAIDKIPGDKRSEIVERDADGYAHLVLGGKGVLAKAIQRNRVDIVQYILLWTADLLSGTSLTYFEGSQLPVKRRADFVVSVVLCRCPEFFSGTPSVAKPLCAAPRAA